MDQEKLPVKNDRGYYEIRLESIGGLGANLCGKMLGELGVTCLKLNAASFSSYGSEKRGSPVKAHIRWSEPDVEIQLNSPIESPHTLGLFHEAMTGKVPVTAGLTEKSKVVINTSRSPEDIQKALNLCGGEIFCIDAQKIAMESKTRINMVMLGAICKASNFVPLDAAIKITEETIGKKYPDLIEKNIDGVRRGYNETISKFFERNNKIEPLKYKEAENRWGYENAPIGGINTRIGSTVSNDLSASREGYIPLFVQEKCINCGLCDTTCPDMVFQFMPGTYKEKPAMVNMGLDYHHCKGCLRCVDVCPTNALVAGLEREHPDKKWFVRNKDLIVDKLEYEDAGANSWVTSEAYLDEKRVDGGIV